MNGEGKYAKTLVRYTNTYTHGRAAVTVYGVRGLKKLDWAGLDEGLLSFCLPHSRLYGESL